MGHLKCNTGKRNIKVNTRRRKKSFIKIHYWQKPENHHQIIIEPKNWITLIFFLEVSRDQSRNQRLQRVIHLKPGYEMNVSTLFIFVYFIFSITKKFIIIIFLMKYIAIVAVVRYLHLISFLDGAYNNNLSAYNNQKYRLK